MAFDWSVNEVSSQPKSGKTMGDRVSAGIDNYQAGLYGVGEAASGALGLKGAEDWMRDGRESNEFLARKSLERAASNGAIDSYKDVHGVGDAFNYAGGLAAQSLPYMAEMAAGGLVARGLSGGLRAAVNAGGTGAEAAQAALDTRSMLGGAAASYPSGVGDVLQNQREEGDGHTNFGVAAALGVPYAAFNLLGEGAALSRGGLPKGAGFGLDRATKYLDDMTGIKGGLARTGATMGRVGLEEAVGESSQEMINQAGRMAVNPDASMFSQDAMDRYGESAVGGGALGLLMGGLGGWRRSHAYQQAQNTANKTTQDPTDLLQLPHDPNVSSARNGVYDNNPMIVLPDGSTVLRSQATIDELEYAARQAGQPVDMGALNAETRVAASTRGIAPSAQAAIDQATGLAQQPYAGKNYAAQFEAAANAPTGQRVAITNDGQLENNDNAITEVQRRAGILQAEQQAAAELAQRQQAIKDEKARLEQVKTRAVSFGAPPSTMSVQLFDALEKKYGINGVNNKEAFDENVNHLANSAPKKVKEHLGLNQKKEAPNVSVQTVSGQQPMASSAGQVAQPVGSVAASGSNAAPAVGVSGAPAVDAAASGKVDVQPTGTQAVPVATVTPAAPKAAEPKPGIGKLVNAAVERAKQHPVVVGGSIDFKNLALVLEPLSPQMHLGVKLMLGLDKDGLRNNKPLSAQAAAERIGLATKGKQNSEISRMANALGLDTAVRNRFVASSSNTNTYTDDAEETARAERSARTNEIEDVMNDNAGVGEKRDITTAEESKGQVDETTMNDAGISTPNSIGGSKGRTDAIKKGRLATTKLAEEIKTNGLTKWLPQGDSPDGVAKKAKELAKVLDTVLRYNPDVADNLAEITRIMSLVKEATDVDRRFGKLVELAMFNLTTAKEVAYEESTANEQNDAAEEPAGEVQRDGEAAGGGESVSDSGRDEPVTGDGTKSTAAVRVKKKRTVEKPQFSKSEPVAVSIEYNGHSMKFPDAQKTIAQLEDKIERHKSLLACLGG